MPQEVDSLLLRRRTIRVRVVSCAAASEGHAASGAPESMAGANTKQHSPVSNCSMWVSKSLNKKVKRQKISGCPQHPIQLGRDGSSLQLCLACPTASPHLLRTQQQLIKVHDESALETQVCQRCQFVFQEYSKVAKALANVGMGQ